MLQLHTGIILLGFFFWIKILRCRRDAERLAQTEEKPKTVALQTKWKMPSMPFNITYFFLSFSWLQHKDSLKHVICNFRFLKFPVSEFFQSTISFYRLSSLTCYAHMILIKSICKAIKDYSVLQGSLSHFHSSSHMNDMRSLQEGISKGVRCLHLQYTIQPDHWRDRPLPAGWRYPSQILAVSPAACSAYPSRACQLACHLASAFPW